MEIVTANLRLDPLCGEDAAALFACRRDPRVSRWKGWKPDSLAEAVREPTFELLNREWLAAPADGDEQG